MKKAAPVFKPTVAVKLYAWTFIVVGVTLAAFAVALYEALFDIGRNESENGLHFWVMLFIGGFVLGTVGPAIIALRTRRRSQCQIAIAVIGLVVVAYTFQFILTAILTAVWTAWLVWHLQKGVKA